VLLIYTATKGFLDDIAVGDVRRFEREFLQFMDTNSSGVLAKIADKKVILDKEIEPLVVDAIKAFKQRFTPTPKVS